MNRTEQKELRNFGLTMGLAIPVVFGLLLPTIFSGHYRLWPWLLGGGFALSGLSWPRSLKEIYRVWMGLARGLGYFNTRLILGLVYFVVITPVGLILRLFGWDPLRIRSKTSAESYRQLGPPNKSVKHMEKPY